MQKNILGFEPLIIKKTLVGIIALAFLVGGIFAGTTQAAGPWFVDPAGNDTNDCLSTLTACLTIQGAITKASPGDTINVASGTYVEEVIVNKTLTLLGAQADVDARNRVAVPESIVSGPNGSFSLEANNVILNGFTVSGSISNAGIKTSPTYSGYQILNNIIEGNVFGLYLHSEGTTQTIVSQNLFNNNNIAGSASGNGIYSDQGLDNVSISDNKFTGAHANASIALVNTTSSDVTISDNEMVNDGTIYLINLSGTNTISGNNVTGSTSHGIQLDGSNDNVTISNNTITGINDGWSAIRVSDNNGSNGSITITNNSLKDNITSTLFESYGINSTDGTATVVANSNDLSNNDIGVRYEPAIPPSNTLDATCNWWGNSNGPGPVGPGSGSPVTTNVDFTSWLTTSNLSGPCNGPLTDSTPNAFAFTDQTGVALNTVIESDIITVAGIDVPANISVTGGEYSINGGAYTAVAGTVNNGDSVRVRHTSSSNNSTAVDTVLTIGTVSDTFTSTTVAASSGGGGGGGNSSGSSGSRGGVQVLGASTEPIPGCDVRTTGFSTVSGVSCANNVPHGQALGESTGQIPGCGTRTTGFSTFNGQSCANNIPHGQIQVLGAHTTPYLPNTGLPPQEQNVPWNVIVPASVLAMISLFFVTRGKMTV